MEYIDGLKLLAERSMLFAGRDLHVMMIANPVAGGFTIRNRAIMNKKYLEDAVNKFSSCPVVSKSCSAEVHLTKAAGHAGIIARNVYRTALEDRNPLCMYLVITAGGDGTSLDVQTAFAQICYIEKNASLSDHVCFLRLPFGTGNDGSDGRTLDKSLALLTDKSVFARQPAVQVYASGKQDRSWFAFNIASVGIDAFITHMTNKLKDFFPGDFYKLWVDLACLFYDSNYRIGKMTAKCMNHDGTSVASITDHMLMFVMGASGFRTYGSNQKILPDENNVCGVRNMSLFRRLKLKKHFKKGTHKRFPETVMCKADRLIVYYGEQILVQLDGEAHLLYPADFPLTMVLTDPFITILRPAGKN